MKVGENVYQAGVYSSIAVPSCWRMFAFVISGTMTTAAAQQHGKRQETHDATIKSL
jgi:hypothetical protein